MLLRSRTELATLYNTFNAETIFAVGDIDTETYNAYEAQLLSLCNIRTDTRTTRRYVGHGIASHVIGYVGQISAEALERLEGQGYQEGDLVGFSGIEETYEAQLAGEPERFLQVTDPEGIVLRELAGTPGTQPQSVTLTLDLELQWAAAQALNDAYNYAATNWASPVHSPGGGVVVLDVDTGAVLAMASYPSFDPGIFGPDTPIFLVGDYISQLTSDTRRPFLNRVAQNSYAPGSTFKIVTLAAAAEERLWNPDELFYCGMEWQGQAFGDTQPVRLDWRATENLEENRFATGDVSMAEALMASCNPFFYQMGAQLFNTRGASMLVDYARRMGFGRNTGFNTTLPEVAGQLPEIRSVEQSINTAIGQDDTQVTILQMARMMAALGNGGTLYRPYVVQQVGRGEGGEPSFVAQPQVEGQLNLSDSTMALLQEAMCNVTLQERVGRSTGAVGALGVACLTFVMNETG
ncbi:MAG: hypothetical protein HC828_17670 [Blastochloris sp.]|nr:hypothetical protein [Blastochloris sp.]